MSQIAFKCVKFFLLVMFGFANTYVISHVFGIYAIVQILVSPSIWEWLLRIAVFIFCFCGAAVIYESSR